MRRRFVSLTTVAAFSALSLGFEAPAVAQPADAGDPVDLREAQDFEQAVDMNVGTLDEPERYEVELEAAKGAENTDDIAYMKVEIPQGHRLHVGFTLEPHAVDSSVQLTADLIDDQGYLSDFDISPTMNAESEGKGLRSGFLISDPMGPENRSYERETFLRLNPQAAEDDTSVPVKLTLTAVPEVVDAGDFEEIDRPKLRFADALKPVDERSADTAIEGTIDAGQTQYHEVPLEWMEAVDAQAMITKPSASGGELSFALYNRIDEYMVVVGDKQLAADGSEDSVLFGQRPPMHPGNVNARLKTRTTGFLDGHVILAVTNSSDDEVGYKVFAAARGETPPPGTQGPVYDPQAAAAEQEQLEEVEHTYNVAPGIKDPDSGQVWRNPLTWLSGVLLIAALIVAGIAWRRR